MSGEKRVAVALSGGPDSMALCWLLSREARKGMEIHALTVDHGLRAESADEARRVARWVKDWPCLRHKILKRDMKGRNAASKIMEAARHDRYALMAEYCRRHKITKLFTAHHLNDQAETFLFRLAKGSGLDGLSCMRDIQPYDESLSVVRPLLDVPKENLVALCEREEIPFVADPSNENPRFARSRLRAALEREGLTSPRLARTASRLARAREALGFYADKVWMEALQEETKTRVVFSFPLLESAPADIRLRVVQRAMEKLGRKGAYPPRLEKLEEIVEEMFSDPPFRRATLGGFMLARDSKRGRVSVEKEKSFGKSAGNRRK